MQNIRNIWSKPESQPRVAEWPPRRKSLAKTSMSEFLEVLKGEPTTEGDIYPLYPTRPRFLIRVRKRVAGEDTTRPQWRGRQPPAPRFPEDELPPFQPRRVNVTVPQELFAGRLPSRNHGTSLGSPALIAPTVVAMTATEAVGTIDSFRERVSAVPIVREPAVPRAPPLPSVLDPHFRPTPRNPTPRIPFGRVMSELKILLDPAWERNPPLPLPSVLDRLLRFTRRDPAPRIASAEPASETTPLLERSSKVRYKTLPSGLSIVTEHLEERKQNPSPTDPEMTLSSVAKRAREGSAMVANGRHPVLTKPVEIPEPTSPEKRAEERQRRRWAAGPDPMLRTLERVRKRKNDWKKEEEEELKKYVEAIKKGRRRRMKRKMKIDEEEG
ncbi:hypothetical protein QBC47DRAFT_439036 [Echria macrotheca]|uniref:Uncharacterized protein n=1 Tax=Echria macrotheca TaxID=438768 RepID=A0AAJ0B6J1_9PEZI|nr:hypothetical protein QBC47DRAFT_439036 [Echria macrotheca]